MRKLRGKPPEKAKAPKPKTIIFGRGGVGKIWATIDFPKVYFIDTEGGANLKHYTDKLKAAGGSYLGPEDGCDDLDFILEEIQSLYTLEHDYKTLVIDSITKAFMTGIMDEANRLEKAGIKNEFGLDRKPAIAKMRKIISNIEKLDMNVILIAHEKTEYKGGEVIGLTYDCWDKVGYLLHMSAHITEVGKKRFMTPIKSRLQNFPEGVPIPWSFEDFKVRYEGEFGEGVLCRDVEVAKLATPDSLAKFKELSEAINLDDTMKSKWLKAAKCDSFEEMEEEQIIKCISNMKVKLDKLTK